MGTDHRQPMLPIANDFGILPVRHAVAANLLRRLTAARHACHPRHCFKVKLQSIMRLHLLLPASCSYLLLACNNLLHHTAICQLLNDESNLPAALVEPGTSKCSLQAPRVAACRGCPAQTPGQTRLLLLGWMSCFHVGRQLAILHQAVALQQFWL